MLDHSATRANIASWSKSPGFQRAVEAMNPYPKRRFILGSILTVSPLFPLGIGMLVSGFRAKAAAKKARTEALSQAADWEPVLCAILIANSRALATPGALAPAALVGAFGPQDDDYFDALNELVEEVGELYGEDPAQVPPHHRSFVQLVNDDAYTPNRRRPVPAHLAKGRPFQLFDAILTGDFFSSGQIDQPYVLCAGPALGAGPIVHLPMELAVFSGEGQPAYEPNIIRHGAPAQSPEIVAPVCENLDAISDHLEDHLGEISHVFHELVSTTIHLDLHIIPPTPARPWNTVVTTGMSEIPMSAPKGAEEFTLAELMIRLPADWPLSQEGFADEENYWPLRWMKILARFPHEYETWLCHGHTIPNGDPPEPFTPRVPFAGILLASPTDVPEDFSPLFLPDGKPVHFWSIIPITAAEMDFKLTHGTDALLDLLAEAGHSDLLDIHRASVC